ARQTVTITGSSPARSIGKELSTPRRLLRSTVCYCRRLILIISTCSSNRPNAAENEHPSRFFDDSRRGELPHSFRMEERGNPSFLHEFAAAAGRYGMMQSILVTGGAGYVGSHACKALAGAGYRPVVYDNLSRGHREAVRWGPLIEGDLHDTDQVAAALQTHRVTAVMHFAAYAYVGESVGEPATYYRNNVGGTLALLEAMRRTGTATIVFSSTCAVYG